MRDSGDWASWWRGDSLREPRPEPEREPERDYTADWLMVMGFHNIRSQAEFEAALRRCDYDIAHLIADLLTPSGSHGWKLILKRSRRGPPLKEEPGVITHFYEEAVRNGGKRGAIKRLLGKHDSPEKIRSAVRREAGTHTKRRKKRGRK